MALGRVGVVSGRVLRLPRAISVGKLLLVALISIVTLWWALEDVDVRSVGRQVAGTRGDAIASYLAIQVVAQAARLLRWWLLLRPLGVSSVRVALASGLVGIPAAFLLPLRLGEFVRPAMLARAGTPFAGGMAAIVVERVADGLVNLGLFFALLAWLPDGVVPRELRPLAVAALVVFLGGLVGLVAAAFARGQVLALIDRGLRPLSQRLAGAVARLLGTFLDGLVVLGNWRRIVGFAATTCLFWGLNGLSTQVLAEARVEDLPMVAGPFTVSVSVFATMIPGGPGAIGTFEAGYRLGLMPFGLTAEDAAVVSLMAHGLQIGLLFVMVALGFVVLRRVGSKQGANDPPSKAAVGD